VAANSSTTPSSSIQHHRWHHFPRSPEAPSELDIVRTSAESVGAGLGSSFFGAGGSTQWATGGGVRNARYAAASRWGTCLICLRKRNHRTPPLPRQESSILDLPLALVAILNPPPFAHALRFLVASSGPTWVASATYRPAALVGGPRPNAPCFFQGRLTYPKPTLLAGCVKYIITLISLSLGRRHPRLESEVKPRIHLHREQGRWPERVGPHRRVTFSKTGKILCLPRPHVSES